MNELLQAGPSTNHLIQLSNNHANILKQLLSNLSSDFNTYKTKQNKLNTFNRSKQLLSQLPLFADKENNLSQRVFSLEQELSGSIHARDEAVAKQYKLESRLTQALKDCQGLSTSSAGMRSQQRKDHETIAGLESQITQLQQQLKQSVPAEKVQSVLEAAAQRVAGICDGAQKSKNDLDRANREIKRLQGVVDNIPNVIEEKTKEEIRQRKRSDMIAKDERKRADKLERKLIELERSTNQLKSMLKSAQEGIGVMKTIARIRNSDVGSGGSGGSIGFDAVAKTITGVTNQVDARLQMKKMNSSKGRSKSKGKFGNNKGVFANMVTGR